MDGFLRLREQLVKHLNNLDRAKRCYKELREIRRMCGCDQAYMAMLADTNRQYIVHVEQGRANQVGAEPLRRILEAYDKLRATYNEAVYGVRDGKQSDGEESPGGDPELVRAEQRTDGEAP